MNKTNDNILKELLDNYNINGKDREEFLKIINPIYKHKEFQERMTSKFPHHGDIPLGVHILEVSILTYLLSYHYKNKSNFNIKIAVRIAMMHDLYTLPWQNNSQNNAKKIINKHGFRHPIEAVINATNWYPEIFNNEEDAQKIIDGIVHHMYPFPVRCFNNDKTNKLELKNFSLISNMTDTNKRILFLSSNRNRIGNLCLCHSIYLEGIIVSRADRIISRRKFIENRSISSVLALITGKNKSLKY